MTKRFFVILLMAACYFAVAADMAKIASAAIDARAAVVEEAAQ